MQTETSKPLWCPSFSCNSLLPGKCPPKERHSSHFPHFEQVFQSAGHKSGDQTISWLLGYLQQRWKQRKGKMGIGWDKLKQRLIKRWRSLLNLKPEHLHHVPNLVCIWKVWSTESYLWSVPDSPTNPKPANSMHFTGAGSLSARQPWCGTGCAQDSKE